VPPPRTRTVRLASAHARRRVAQASGEPGRSARGIERELLALPGRGEDLAWIRQAQRIEGVLHPAHDGHVDGRVLERHVAVLLHADAVLARDRAAHLDAHLEDLPAGLLDPFDLSRPLRA